MTAPDPIAGATAEAARALGKALLAANNPVQALQAFRQALAQDPESVEALNGLAVCYDRLGRFEDARVHYEIALGIDPTSPMLLNNYGLSLYLQGDRQSAERFLSLAAAGGNPDVQAASLRVLARIERDTADTAAGNRLAAAQPEQAVQSALPGPRIVRTSAHEQRLVLDRSPPVVQLASALMPERAMLIEALGGLSAGDDARIAGAELAAIRAEQAARAAAEREARMLLAEARATVPADMQVAALLKAAREAADAAEADRRQQPDFGPPVGPLLGPSPSDTDWHRDQILVSVPGSSSGNRGAGDRASLQLALLAAGLAPVRPVQREALAAAAQAALDSAGPRRSFPDAFESDDGRLNGFAARVQGAEPAEEGPTISERVARLEALIQRVQAA